MIFNYSHCFHSLRVVSTVLRADELMFTQKQHQVSFSTKLVKAAYHNPVNKVYSQHLCNQHYKLTHLFLFMQMISFYLCR